MAAWAIGAALVFSAVFLAGAQAPQDAPTPKQLACRFGKSGSPSSLSARLAAPRKGDESVYEADLRLDRRRLFGRSIKFLLSETETGSASFGAGVLTSKSVDKTYYAELFILMDKSSGAATFEATANGVSVSLHGNCKAR